MFKYIFLTTLLAVSCLPRSLHAKQTVLIIESYHAEHAWDKSYVSAIRKELENRFTIVTFQLNTKRIPYSEFGVQADKAFAYFKELKPDFVVLGDDNAARLLGTRLPKDETTVIYLGVSGNPREYGLYGMPNVYGVIEYPLIKRSVVTISQLVPNIKSFLIVFDNSVTSHKILEQIFDNKRHFGFRGINAEIKLITYDSEWKKNILESKNKGYDAILLGTYHTLVTQDGQHIHENDILEWTNKNSPLPLFGTWDFSIGKGKAIGGLILTGEDQGLEAARLIQEVSQQNQVLPLPITPLPRFLLSEHETKRWNLTPSHKIDTQIRWTE